MSSSQVPSLIVDPPNPLLEAALQDPRIILNLRPDHWPKAVVDAYRANRPWQIRAQLYHAHFMYPALMQFLSELQPDTKTLICCQDTKGGVMTLVDTVKEVYWTDESGLAREGVHAQIRLENNHRFGAPTRSVWGNYTLAIAAVRPEASVMNTRDKDGARFIETLEKFGVA